MVTSTERLARELRREYGDWQRGRGRVVWESPEVVSWPVWLGRLWRGVRFAAPGSPVLLSAAQDTLLWEQIIGASPEGEFLMDPRGTALKAREAWLLGHGWRISVEDSTFSLTEDTAAFRDWAREFHKRCHARGWLDEGRLPDRVGAAIEQEVIAAPRLWLAGFDDFSPQQRRLLEVIRRCGGEWREHRFTPHPSPERLRASAPTTSGELQAAARWARARLEENPRARIGIVARDLDGVRTAAANVFSKILAPNAFLRGGGRPLFHIASGGPLSEAPVTQAALLLLRTAGSRVTIPVLSRLLRSPFLAGWGEEADERALLDLGLRRGEYELAWRAVAGRGREQAVLNRAIHASRRAWEAAPEEAGPGAWAAIFSGVLEAWGWPGDRTLESEEHQAMEAWREMLADLASLDALEVRWTRGAALAQLEALAARRPFQPRDEGAPVQILPVQEPPPPGLDGVWLLGFDAGRWPDAPRPNPFLPLAVQGQLGMPRSSPRVALAEARRMTARLLAAAPVVVVSHASTEEDHNLAPSPLITGVPAVGPENLRLAADVWYDSWPGTVALEAEPDTEAPPLAPGTLQRGGTRVLQLQSACPFRAFAEFRLGAREIESPELGLSPRDKGVLMHSVLHKVWAAVGSQARLKQLGEADLTEIVQRAISEAVEAKTQLDASALTLRIRDVEKERLERLVSDWMRLEADRPSTFEVAEQEVTRTAVVGPLELEMRADRVDRLEDGRLVVLDYKSSPKSVEALLGSRPEEPQLPFYCTQADGEVAAVAFAMVGAKRIGFAGLSSETGLLSDVKPPKDAGFAETKASWRSTLEALANEFALGHAPVDPRSPDDCSFCHLGALCRIDGEGAEAET